MAEFTTREIEYMDYLDDLYPCGEHSFGLLLFKADIVAFNCGLDEYFQAKEEKSVVDQDKESMFTFEKDDKGYYCEVDKDHKEKNDGIN